MIKGSSFDRSLGENKEARRYRDQNKSRVYNTAKPHEQTVGVVKHLIATLDDVEDEENEMLGKSTDICSDMITRLLLAPRLQAILVVCASTITWFLSQRCQHNGQFRLAMASIIMSGGIFVSHGYKIGVRSGIRLLVLFMVAQLFRVATVTSEQLAQDLAEIRASPALALIHVVLGLWMGAQTKECIPFRLKLLALCTVEAMRVLVRAIYLARTGDWSGVLTLILFSDLSMCVGFALSLFCLRATVHLERSQRLSAVRKQLEEARRVDLALERADEIRRSMNYKSAGQTLATHVSISVSEACLEQPEGASQPPNVAQIEPVELATLIPFRGPPSSAASSLDITHILGDTRQPTHFLFGTRPSTHSAYSQSVGGCSPRLDSPWLLDDAWPSLTLPFAATDTISSDRYSL